MRYMLTPTHRCPSARIQTEMERDTIQTGRENKWSVGAEKRKGHR